MTTVVSLIYAIDDMVWAENKEEEEAKDGEGDCGQEKRKFYTVCSAGDGDAEKLMTAVFLVYAIDDMTCMSREPE